MGKSEGGVLEMCQNSEIYMKIFYFKIPSEHNPSDVKCMYKDYRFRPLSTGHHQVTCIQV